MSKSMQNKDFFYYISPLKFFISDLTLCDPSERSIDIPLFDLANNEKLLSILNLYYIVGTYGTRYTYESRAKWFCGYLSSFCREDDGQYEKSITNPMVRVLFEDANMLTMAKEILCPVI